MSTPLPPPVPPKMPDPAPKGEQPPEDLDLEEDIAPNLGGEDRMQDA